MKDVFKAIVRMAKEKKDSEPFTSGFGEVREFQKELLKKQKKEK